MRGWSCARLLGGGDRLRGGGRGPGTLGAGPAGPDGGDEGGPAAMVIVLMAALVLDAGEMPNAPLYADVVLDAMCSLHDWASGASLDHGPEPISGRLVRQLDARRVERGSNRMW